MSWSVLRSFTISRALVLLFAIFGYLLISSVHVGFNIDLPQSTPWYLSVWYQWDAHWYMSISSDGYQWIQGDQSNVAFFPLYPLLVKVIGGLFGGHYLETGLLLSAVFLFAGLLFFYKLVRIDFSDAIAGRAVWFLAIFPTTVFFNSFYTESLFMFTSIAAFYYARKKRWALAGIWGFLAALTRITGTFILLPLLYEYLSQRSFSFKRLRPSVLWISLIPVGLLTYMAYLYYSFGLPLAFAETQASGWGHELTSFTASISHDISILVRQWELWVIYEFAATVLLLVAIIAGIKKKLPGSYILYMIISLLFPLAGGTTKSMSRYLLVVFPLFIVIALFTEKRSFRWAASAASIVLLGFSTMAFVTGRWVA
jgi:Gpi18-like mannosyltransferase